MHRIYYLLGISLFLLSCHTAQDEAWPVYGGSKANNRYSSLVQVDTANVSRLRVAWTYHTGDAGDRTQIQVNPLVIDGVLFGVSPRLKLFALDAATGKEKWVFNPIDSVTLSRGAGYFSMNVCRGVTYFDGGRGDQRIFFAASSQLYCIDAVTGKPIASFADGGKLDLHNDLGERSRYLYVATTTPGIIYKDMLIIGTRVAEEAAAAPGYIRAYDVHSGRLRWIFHTIPLPGEAGYETWEDTAAYRHIGGANTWSGFSLDEEKGILFAPTGSASYDFYGGKRPGQNLYANCILAIDAATGRLKWHFQTVHHDVWDRDLPTAPALVTISKDGKKTEAIAQPSKAGLLYLFERTTGQPIYPINEIGVPTETELAGEKLHPTQPWPVFPAFTRTRMTENDLNKFIPDSSYQDILQRFRGYKHYSPFTPPSKEGTIIFPGFDGGAEWSGPAYDPQSGIVYINANEMPWILTITDAKAQTGKPETNLEAGTRLYTNTCMTCHGAERQGSGNNPALTGIDKKYNLQQVIDLISTGRRMMPGFPQLSVEEKNAIASYILGLKQEQTKKFVAPQRATDPYYQLPYTSTGYNKFLTKEGYPAVSPPWGTLTAINLNTGEVAWKNVLGEYPELTAKGIPPTGTENYGGAVVTAGGLLFIAATRDGMIRAFNKRTGQLLWQAGLPAPGFATPATYSVNGKQYLVIACGGGKLNTISGDAYVAFALP